MDYLIVSILLFLLNLVTECHNFSCSMCHFQSQASIYLLNYFPLLTQLNWVESYESIQLVLSGDLSEFSRIPYSLLLLIIYTLMFFPLPPLGRW